MWVNSAHNGLQKSIPEILSYEWDRMDEWNIYTWILNFAFNTAASLMSGLWHVLKNSFIHS